MSRTTVAILGWAVWAMAVSPFPAHAETRYVSPSGLHVAPFTNWVEAATNMQSAIDVSSPGDVVMVTNGLYAPESTVRVTNHVTLASLNGRETVVLDGSALPPGQDAVFLQFGTLDGLTISNAPRHGVKSEYGAVVNSLVTHSGQQGIDSYTTPRIVTNSTLIVTNTLIQKSGGIGLFTCAVDTRILGCTIAKSADSGVALRQNDTTGVIQVPRVSNFLIRASTVASNLNSGISLAFWNYSPSLPDVPVRIEECLIEHNTGGHGGGVADSGGSSTDRGSGVHITRSLIRNNNATIRGGGVYLYGSRLPSINNSTLEGNTSAGAGGGAYHSGGSMFNCLVRNNTSLSDGGGAYGGILRNNTIIFNSATRGGGIGMSDAANCIIFYNGASSSSNTYASALSHSCSAPLAAGTGNISAPPGFAGYRNGRLVAASPCIDAGNLWLSDGDYDLEGDPRVWGSNVDMGCDEFYPPALEGPLSVEVSASADRAVVGAQVTFRCNVDGKPEAYAWLFSDGYTATNTFQVDRTFDAPGNYTATVTAWNPDGAASNSVSIEIFPGYTNFVSPSGGHVSPFTNWLHAATNIQDAIDANIPGGVVRVDDGVYATGGRTVGGSLASRIAITNALDVVSVNGPDHTWIVGQGPNGNDAVRCVYVAAGARLSGFTLTNGHTLTAGLPDLDQSGGGAWCEPGATVENCLIRNNAAHQAGGGVRNGTVRQSTLWANQAGQGGGADGATLAQCIVSNNVAFGEGGGANGGTLENVLVVDNQAEYGGGAANATLLHATVARNHATQSGGGIYRGMAENSILYFNTAGASWPNYFNAVCRYTCTTPDPQSTGTITDDPRFVDVANGLFRLLRDSPAVDAAQASDLAVDLLGVPRPLPADMGAYEFTAVHYVAPEGGHVYPFITWADAANDLQSAIDAADPLDDVWVSNGVYNAGGRVYQGALTNRVVIDKPIQVASVNGHGSTIIEGHGPVGDAAIRGVMLGTNASLVGFTVRGGATRAVGELVAEQSGGGIWCEPGATIFNCVVVSNSAHAYGGAVYGGRMLNTFLGGNSAAQGGGLAHGQMEFCTVAGNSAVDGGGAYGSTGQTSIIYYNEASGVGPNVQGGAWTSCCVIPDPGGSGHITNAPGLLSLQDYRLAPGSPCIDALPPEPSFPDHDLDGIPRPLDGNNSGTAWSDIGAQEYVHSTSDTDGDGLADYDEIFIHRTDPLQADTDDDGQTDGQEILAGTDPLNPDSFFAITRIDSDENGSVFVWPGLAGRQYTILTTADLMMGSWSNRPDYTDRPGMDGLMAFTNATPPGLAVYRVRIQPSP
jgi:hypothetical protein